jgi:hypothetical protein
MPGFGAAAICGGGGGRSCQPPMAPAAPGWGKRIAGKRPQVACETEGRAYLPWEEGNAARRHCRGRSPVQDPGFLSCYQMLAGVLRSCNPLTRGNV